MEYAQLNHDTDHHRDHGNHGDHSAQDNHTEIDSSVDNNTADYGEWKHDPMPDCYWEYLFPYLSGSLMQLESLVLKDLKQLQAIMYFLYFCNALQETSHTVNSLALPLKGK